jgi:hypothetical protein
MSRESAIDSKGSGYEQSQDKEVSSYLKLCQDKEVSSYLKLCQDKEVSSYLKLCQDKESFQSP